MKTLFLHVGPHKTGTTYIQNCLAKSAGKLAGSGIVYPVTGTTPTVPYLCGHHELVLWLAGKQNKRNAFEPKQLQDDLGDAEAAIISSENTCNLSNEELIRIRDYFVGWSVRPVIFLRRRSAILRSQWQENIKWGEYYDISEFLVSEFIHPFKSNLVNQKLLLDKMAEVFGKDSLIVMNYDRTIENGDDIVDALMARLFGNDAVSVASGETLNSSLPFSMVELIRVFNAAYISIGGVPRDVVRGIVLNLFREKARNQIHAAHELIQEVSAAKTSFVDIGNMDSLFPSIARSILSEYKDQLPAGQSDALFSTELQEPIPMVRIADLLFSLSETLRLKDIAREYFPSI